LLRPNEVLNGSHPQKLFPFIAILFASGLDVGLIMFPLVEFPIYAAEEPYQFTNPLAFMFGTWGFIIWAMYFVTTFYFCAIEPKLKIFEIPFVKLINNVVIIGTCAFTGYLFLSYLPDYVQGISNLVKYALVATVVVAAVYSSTKLAYVKVLSVGSTWVFFALICSVWLYSGAGFGGLGNSIVLALDYFPNIHKFLAPVTDYHGFYLFWWMAWSIMIGQFVSRFVGNLKTWQLLIALLVFPSIPILIWFSVLHYFFQSGSTMSPIMNLVMVSVGILFVINSLDSLTRLYTVNLDISVERFGSLKYLIGNFLLLFGLILLYQFTPFKIEWVGLVVIGLYVITSVLIFVRRDALKK
ncbi:MAG: hypothetical protein JKX81_10265, partial [Arenicella sp.]|nr:hypothetical protein [Arenicella sp.]